VRLTRAEAADAIQDAYDSPDPAETKEP
jgi:hypothetical protein